jgi:hypothetical protein
VAVNAPEGGVRAFHVGGTDGDVFALGIFQAGGRTVAKQAIGGLLSVDVGGEKSSYEEYEKE